MLSWGHCRHNLTLDDAGICPQTFKCSVCQFAVLRTQLWSAWAQVAFRPAIIVRVRVLLHVLIAED